jgi:hypothetical protein
VRRGNCFCAIVITGAQKELRESGIFQLNSLGVLAPSCAPVITSAHDRGVSEGAHVDVQTGAGSLASEEAEPAVLRTRR